MECMPSSSIEYRLTGVKDLYSLSHQDATIQYIHSYLPLIRRAIPKKIHLLLCHRSFLCCSLLYLLLPPLTTSIIASLSSSKL